MEDHMKRREFNKIAIAAGVSMRMKSIASAADSPQTSKRPNILFIMTDQQHRNMMSCTGNKWLKTPALDGLAKGGIRFDRSYCTNPVCVPSRISMATGVMSCRLGATSNKPGMNAKVPAEVSNQSLGRLMKSAGYDTFYGGKVHMCSALAPKNAGYDVCVKDERNKLPVDCIKFIKTKRDKPFFAMASFINPHDICYAHKARLGGSYANVKDLYKKALDLPLDELPPLPDNYAIQENEPGGIADHLSTKAITPSGTMRKDYDETAWRVYRWIYHRLTEQVDANIGKILDGLKKSGLEDNTLIIFTSDHGNMDASHHLASKGFFYEESVGVPLILSYKGNIPAGRVDEKSLASTGLDILPTICDYASVTKPAHCLGESLRPLAEGKSVDNWRSYAAAENGGCRMIRSEQYKYCAFADNDSKESLVDLEKDPGEMRNLVDDPTLKNVLADHRKLLADWSKLSSDKDASQYVKKG
jgi:arylsulfatase A-like enzyme